MTYTKVNSILHEIFIDFKDLNPEVDIQEKHGYKDSDDGKKQEAKHNSKVG